VPLRYRGRGDARKVGEGKDAQAFVWNHLILG
jgi:hypothetical protein